MKNILILGAGQSAPYCIQFLLDQAAEHDWFVTVGDRDEQLARSRVGDHPRGATTYFEVNDLRLRDAVIRKADLVVNLLPPPLQPLIAELCVEHGTHFVSASYRDQRLRDLDHDARAADVILLPEVGLDPGIDIMSAMETIQRVRNDGGHVERFVSYGSGVLAPEVDANPLRYAITWNPRNVVMAAEQGAQYLLDDQIKIVPWHHVFWHSWPVEVDGVGTMEAYPNRDSLSYKEVFGLSRASTVIRGTLRYPGWSETWLQVVRLGLPEENIRIPHLSSRSFAEIVEMFLPRDTTGSGLQGRVANYLNISPTGQIMKNLKWLGLFDTDPCNAPGHTSADALVHLLRNKLVLPPDARDMVVIQHDLTVCYPQEDDRRERIIATFKHFGDAGGMTAMAKTVGLPAALAAKLILTGELPLTGSHLPTHERIYSSILRELEREGLGFEQRVEPLSGPQTGGAGA